MAKTYRNAMLFEYLRNILSSKSERLFRDHVSHPDFDRDFQPYLVITYLSMSPAKAVRDFILDNQLSLDRMKGRQLYRVLFDNIPEQANSFIKFIK